MPYVIISASELQIWNFSEIRAGTGCHRGSKMLSGEVATQYTLLGLLGSCPKTLRKCSRSPRLWKQLEVQNIFKRVL